MKTLTLVFFNILFCTLAHADVIYEFKDSLGYEYKMLSEFVIPGFSARNVFQGFIMAQIKAPVDTPSTDQNKKSLADQLYFEIEKTKEDQKSLEKIDQDIKKQLSQHSNKIPSKDPSTPPPVTKNANNKLNWGAFYDCAEDSLPLLKKIIRIEFNQQSEGKTSKDDELLKGLLSESIGTEGLACGKHLPEKWSISVISPIENVKILTAFLKRRKLSERQLLLKTLLGSHSKHADSESLSLFTYYFSRQFLAASLTIQSLPTYESLNEEIVKNPISQPLFSLDQKTTVRAEMIYTKSDLEQTLGKGLIKVESLLK